MLGGLLVASLRPAGSVDRTAVQDNCASAEEEPGWAGTSECTSDLDLHTNGDLSVKRAVGGMRLELRGPKYKSSGHPCELDIRNDQPVTSVPLETAALARLAVGRAHGPDRHLHPAPGVAYVPTPNCSHFPHLYDGVEYFYDCEDTGGVFRAGCRADLSG